MMKKRNSHWPLRASVYLYSFIYLFILLCTPGNINQIDWFINVKNGFYLLSMTNVWVVKSHPFAFCLPRQDNSQWTWPISVGGTYRYMTWMWVVRLGIRSVEVCVMTPGPLKSIQCCVKTWAVGIGPWLPSTHLEYKTTYNTSVFTPHSPWPNWPSASSSRMKIRRGVNQPTLFAQVMTYF